MNQFFRPVFVVGYPRSGTTMLHSLLCTAPNANKFVKECSWITKIVEAYAYGVATFEVHTSSYFDTVDDFTAYNASLLGRVLSDVWARLGKPENLVLKDPELLGVVPEICSLLPEATIAVLVRDVRDVAASQVVRIRKQKNDPHWYDSGYVHEQAARYASLYGRLLGAAPRLAGRVKCLRYEVLAREVPLARLETLLGLCGLDASKLWRRSSFDIKEFENNEASSKLFGSAISASNVGRHLRVLISDDAARIEKVMPEVNQLFALYEGIQ